MLNHLPKHLPPFAELLADLGPVEPSKVANALGISERTLRRYMAGKAPRIARLSLWWLSWNGYTTWDEIQRRRYDLARWSLELQRKAGADDHLVRLQALRVVRERPFRGVATPPALEGAATVEAGQRQAPRRSTRRA